jgi:hypothetical protein
VTSISLGGLFRELLRKTFFSDSIISQYGLLTIDSQIIQSCLIKTASNVHMKLLSTESMYVQSTNKQFVDQAINNNNNTRTVTINLFISNVQSIPQKINNKNNVSNKQSIPAITVTINLISNVQTNNQTIELLNDQFDC